MKKLFVLALCVVAAVGITACNKTKKASAVALEHADMLKNGNYDLFVEEFHFEPTKAATDVAAEKTTYKNNYRTHVHPVIQAKGGIKETKVVSESVSDDGKNATVVLNHEYNNGHKEDVTYAYTLVDNSWRLADGHLREVWRTQTPDGEHVTIRLRENEYKDVLKENFEDGDRIVEKEIDTDRRHVEKEIVDGERQVEKVIERHDGTIVTKEKVDGEREVHKYKPE